MHQLTIQRRYYITASAGSTHRVLKIDRTEADTLNVVEDSMQYDDEQRDLLLRMVEDGNKSQGGLNHLLNFYGIVGFVKFTTVWYLIVITQRSVVGLLGGHYSELGSCRNEADISLSLRQDEGDELTPLREADHQLLPISQKTNSSAQEARCVLPPSAITDATVCTVCLIRSTCRRTSTSRGWPLTNLPADASYSYDITNTLQKNLTTPDNERLWNARFMWNYHLLQPAFDLENPKERSQWVLPMIHGSFDQTSGLTASQDPNPQKSTSSLGRCI